MTYVPCPMRAREGVVGDEGRDTWLSSVSYIATNFAERTKLSMLLMHIISGAWRSPVARLLWEQEVAGSNPAAPTDRLMADVQLSPDGASSSARSGISL